MFFRSRYDHDRMVDGFIISQTCIKRSVMGQIKSGLQRGSIQMKFSTTGQKRRWPFKTGDRQLFFCLFNQCLSPLGLRVRIPLRWGVLDTTLCDQVCQWLVTCLWFSPYTLVSSTNKTDCHYITEILLKVALNTITLFLYVFYCCAKFFREHLITDSVCLIELVWKINYNKMLLMLNIHWIMSLKNVTQKNTQHYFI